MIDPLDDACRGRWQSILISAGVNPKILDGKHHACPVCGGKDRFRFTDMEGRGLSICNQCGGRNGFQLIMDTKGIGFTEAKRIVESKVGTASFKVQRAVRSTAEENADRMAALWRRARPLDGSDLASRYLQGRGIWSRPNLSGCRFLAEMERYDGKTKSIGPAMLSRMVAPDKAAATSILHVTYLTESGTALLDGDGKKIKKFMPGVVPDGGAVRLMECAGDTLGVAEGVETALSAFDLFNRAHPVWACLSTVGLLKWRPPSNVTRVLIFSDQDDNFAGQACAFSLANKLAIKHKLTAISVHLPADGMNDFNDQLRARS